MSRNSYLCMHSTSSTVVHYKTTEIEPWSGALSDAIGRCVLEYHMHTGNFDPQKRDVGNFETETPQRVGQGSMKSSGWMTCDNDQTRKYQDHCAEGGLGLSSPDCGGSGHLPRCTFLAYCFYRAFLAQGYGAADVPSGDPWLSSNLGNMADSQLRLRPAKLRCASRVVMLEVKKWNWWSIWPHRRLLVIHWENPVYCTTYYYNAIMYLSLINCCSV